MSIFVHGDNLTQKETHRTKYQDARSKQYLAEIRLKYEAWKTANLALVGPTKEVTPDDEEIIKKRVALFNEYKDFIDQQIYAEQFDSRSNLHSSALEEFMYYLFKDIVADYSTNALIGKSRAFKELSFKSDNYDSMLVHPGALLEVKDYDFVIGATINATFRCKGKDSGDEESFDMPAVAIECKTYLDKTMLESCSTTGEQLKRNNPNALYIVVAERLKFIVVPATSSERRRYIPIGFLDADTIATNAVIIIPDATLYHFGILTANVHMAWMRTVAGRLEMRYRYSKDVVYNNFPWPDPTDAQRQKIEQTAQGILDARSLYPEASLADLYDEFTMPLELRRAHQANDRAVMESYGIKKEDPEFKSEAACVSMLMKMYRELTETE